MRANIAGLIVLSGLVALHTSFVPSPVVTEAVETSRPLTTEEMDCAVGGEAGCIELAVNTTESCLEDAGINGSEIGDNLYNIIVGGICTLDGAWTGLTCAWEWFSGLF
jgi:hypothetical protein